jgi:hypothetical protein
MVRKGEHFAGEHPAIIPTELWEAVQDKLKTNASGTSRRLKSQQPSLLVGRVFPALQTVTTMGLIQSETL